MLIGRIVQEALGTLGGKRVRFEANTHGPSGNRGRRNQLRSRRTARDMQARRGFQQGRTLTSFPLLSRAEDLQIATSFFT